MPDATWLREKRWGVFVHFLTGPETSADEWNRQVDAFGCERLADQLARVGAGYFCLTVGQGSGHYCAPNARYDHLAGIRPSKCSQRDLMADMAGALRPRGIDFLAYVPADGSNADPAARAALGMGRHWDHELGFDWTPGPHWAAYRWPEYHANWEAVCREWSERWGDRVRGWWVDGAFAPDLRYPAAETPNLKTLGAALRAGNPEAVVAYNTGVFLPPVHSSDDEDYIAGELHAALPECTGGWVERAGGHRALFHILTYLGRGWGAAVPRFPISLAVGYSQHVASFGGAVTWDVPCGPDGAIPEVYRNYLSAIGEAMRALPGTAT